MHEPRTFNFEAQTWLVFYSTSLDVGHHLWLITPYDPINVPVNMPIIEYKEVPG